MRAGLLALPLVLLAASVSSLAPAAAQAAPAAPAAGAGDGEAGAGSARRVRSYGRSGALRAWVAEIGPLPELAAAATPARSRWVPAFPDPSTLLLGEPAFSIAPPTPSLPGIWRREWEAPRGRAAEPESYLIVPVPFTAKRDGVLNGYRIGRYPTEGTGRADRYAPPRGFIEVTPANKDFRISEHFRLRDFLTKDQHDVWPKYLVLDLRLIDKLELVLQELNAMGVRADRMHVMSGFRTPQYNGPGTGGRASLSRHMYGDAADVWVDNDGNGHIDDLNGDGVADLRDTEVMLRAVKRVEARYPELVGGAGLYVGTAAHGPFIHVDVRGSPARW